MLMTRTVRFDSLMRLVRLPYTAGDLMTVNPVSLNEEITVQEAAAFLTGRRISAAPVINAAGRPIGVVSQSDIARQAARDPNVLLWVSRFCAPDEDSFLDEVFERETRVADAPGFGGLTVGQIMTPRVYCVTPDTPVVEVVRKLLDCQVHRLFVTDEDGVLVGVITALDILRSLRR